MCVTEAFEAYAGGIFHDTTNCTAQMHEISIAGYGVSDEGEKFWVGRNSWGTYWGEHGWFKVLSPSLSLSILSFRTPSSSDTACVQSPTLAPSQLATHTTSPDALR